MFDLNADTLANTNPSSPDNNGSMPSLSDIFSGQAFQQNNGNQNSQQNGMNVSPDNSVAGFGAPVEDYIDSNPQPQTQTQNNNNTDNDQVRYQYYQSQWDKEKARNQELEKQLAELKGSVSTIQQMQQNNSQQQQYQQQQEESFPEFNYPQPTRPISFNYQEAYTMPDSESARYLADVQEYNDAKIKYTDLKAQYILAKQQEFEQKIAQQTAMSMRQMEQANKINAIVEEVKGKYGMNHQQAIDFVQKMSDNNVYTLDNMVKFYMTSLSQPQQTPNWIPQQGQYGMIPNGYQPQQPQYQQNYNQNPSDLFNQQRRSQQIPNIMNVLPQQAQPDNNNAKSFMDTILNSENF